MIQHNGWTPNSTATWYRSATILPNSTLDYAMLYASLTAVADPSNFQPHMMQVRNSSPFVCSPIGQSVQIQAGIHNDK